MSASPPPRRTLLTLTLAAACWGIGTVVSKRALEEIAPLALLAIQLAVSLTVLGVLMRWRGMPFRDPSASPVLARLGLLNPGLAYAFSLLGLVHITASLSVLLWALEPLLILFLAGWLLRERLGWSFVTLSLVAVAGMVLVIYVPGGGGSPLGVALTIAGVGCCAIYSVATRKWLAAPDSTASTAQVVAAQQAYALAFALVLVAVAWLLGGAAWPTSWLASMSAAAWASAIASGLLYYALAYWFYLSGLRHVPASFAAVSFYLIPVFGVAGGVLLLGERLDPTQWAGVATVLLGLYLIVRRAAARGYL